jgi:hypothetical protein
MRLVHGIFVAGILAVSAASAAANTINPQFAGTTPVVGGFRWDYDMFLSNGRLDADAGGATTPEQFFTFYDIRGYVPGSYSAANGSWSGSESLIGKTPTPLIPITPDSATGMNVSFTYISSTAITATPTQNIALGTFSFISTFDQPRNGVYTNQDLPRTGAVTPTTFQFSQQAIELPTPDGGSTAVLLGSILVAFGMLRRRLS